jgi:hypothetical protein
MAISHLCISCGWDLARVRVRRDPHYGLPLVHCPECGHTAVRRRHPISDRWRALLRLLTSLLAIVLQLAAAAFFLPMVIAACMEIGQGMPADTFRYYDPRDAVLFGALVFLLALGTGAWFTAGLHHWRRWVPWLVFIPPMAIVLSIDCVIAPAVVQFARERGFTDHFIAYEWDQLLMRSLALAGIMIVAIAGLPLGHAMMALERRFRTWLWRTRRRRLRARRFAG